MPEFRYFKLYNQSTPEKDVNIFPYIKASNGSVIYDGSVTNPDIFVKPNGEFCPL